MSKIWHSALKEFNSNREKWLIPKKGTPEHSELMNIYKKLKNGKHSKMNGSKRAKPTEASNKKLKIKKKKKSCDLPCDLPPDDAQIEGGALNPANIVDAVVGGVRVGPSPSVRNILKKYGHLPVVRITFRREPIQKVFTEIINILTLGDLKKQMKKLNYDDVYHLSSIFHLQDTDGSIIYLFVEKNEVPVMRVVTSVYSGDTISTDIDGKTTLSEAIQNAENKFGKNRIWVYDAVVSNCQRFLLDILEANNWATPAVSKWILQDAAELLSKDKRLQTLMKGVTNLANRIDVAIQGRGIQQQLKKALSQLIAKSSQ